jgi:hypothetical protein
MIQIKNQELSNFYFSSGNWETNINASSKEEALTFLVNELKGSPEVDIGKIIVCVNLDVAVKELTLEEALFFIPIEEIAGSFNG